jgi:hypothetical protein
METKTLTKYEIDANGTIFTEAYTVVLDDGGAEIARSGVSRVPFNPVGLNAGGVPEATDTATITDPKLKVVAEAFWDAKTVEAAAAAMLNQITESAAKN